MNTGKSRAKHIRPIVGMTLISLVVCGLFFPLLVTGIAQAVLPWQANGEILKSNGEPVGSNLIAQNFTEPIFFQPRNDSASGVDPDITVQDAYNQTLSISEATGISQAQLKQLINENTPLISILFGNPYVNVLTLNLALINKYHTVYANYS